MKKIIFLFLGLFLILSASLFYFTLPKEEGYEDKCPIIKTECPDGTPSECNSVLDPDSGDCIDCIPDCTGHETIVEILENNSSGMVLCPEISIPPDFCVNGEIVPVYNSIGCTVDYECN